MEAENLARGTVKDILEYISVGSVAAPLVIYTIALILIPTTLVLSIFALGKLDERKGDIEAASGTEGRSFAEERRAFERILSCINRISCEANHGVSRENSLKGRILRWLIGTKVGKVLKQILPSRTPRSENCSIDYPCWKSAESLDKERLFFQTDQEFTFLNLFSLLSQGNMELPSLTSLILPKPTVNGDDEDENSISSIMTTVGTWGRFSRLLFAICTPIAIAIVALFIAALVTTPPEDNEEVKRIDVISTTTAKSYYRHELGRYSPQSNNSTTNFIPLVEMLERTRCNDKLLCNRINNIHKYKL